MLEQIFIGHASGQSSRPNAQKLREGFRNVRFGLLPQAMETKTKTKYLMQEAENKAMKLYNRVKVYYILANELLSIQFLGKNSGPQQLPL